MKFWQRLRVQKEKKNNINYKKRTFRGSFSVYNGKLSLFY